MSLHTLDDVFGTQDALVEGLLLQKLVSHDVVLQYPTVSEQAPLVSH